MGGRTQLTGLRFGAALALALASVAAGAAAQEVHFSSEERLDAIDVTLIGGAQRSIDFASYALTHPLAIDALNAAEYCESPWNKDPVFGVIGIQSGPRG